MTRCTMWLMPEPRPLTRRRGLVLPAVLFAVLALLLSGCSVIEKQHAAAIVGGQVISNADVATAQEEFNTHLATNDQQKMSESQVLSLLVIGPFVLEQAQKSGSWKPDDRYNSLLAKIPNASEPTKEIIATSLATQSLSQTDVDAILAALKTANVQLDPRFGTFDPKTGGSTVTDNNWIKPSATPSATAPVGQ